MFLILKVTPEGVLKVVCEGFSFILRGVNHPIGPMRLPDSSLSVSSSNVSYPRLAVTEIYISIASSYAQTRSFAKLRLNASIEFWELFFAFLLSRITALIFHGKHPSFRHGTRIVGASSSAGWVLLGWALNFAEGVFGKSASWLETKLYKLSLSLGTSGITNTASAKMYSWLCSKDKNLNFFILILNGIPLLRATSSIDIRYGGNLDISRNTRWRRYCEEIPEQRSCKRLCQPLHP